MGRTPKYEQKTRRISPSLQFPTLRQTRKRLFSLMVTIESSIRQANALIIPSMKPKSLAKRIYESRCYRIHPTRNDDSREKISGNRLQ